MPRATDTVSARRTQHEYVRDDAPSPLLRLWHLQGENCYRAVVSTPQMSEEEHHDEFHRRDAAAVFDAAWFLEVRRVLAELLAE